jgi:hypothetical protein
LIWKQLVEPGAEALADSAVGHAAAEDGVAAECTKKRRTGMRNVTG